jgi:hypothetical protein
MNGSTLVGSLRRSRLEIKGRRTDQVGLITAPNVTMQTDAHAPVSSVRRR